MPSRTASHHYASPTRMADTMSSSPSRQTVDGSVRGIAKQRIKVVVNRPLPNFNFLAPYEPHHPQALSLLQCYVHRQLSLKAHDLSHKKLMSRIRPEDIRLEMDNFVIPLDEPEILRDGDMIEACLANDPGQTSRSFAQPSKTFPRDDSMPTDSDHTDTSTSNASSSEQSSDSAGESADESSSASDLSADQRQVLLEGKRLAAMMKARLHQHLSDNDEADQQRPAKVRNTLHNDLPKPPAISPSNKRVALQTTATSFPSMPLGLENSGGAAAAMAAFEKQKNRLQADKNSTRQVRNSTNLPGVAQRLIKKAADIAAGSSQSQTGSLSSSSGSDSDSDSAPSVEATKKPLDITAASVDTPKTVPPGKGTSRTKRRNLLRRKKIHLLREAENATNFLAAKQRAQEREQQDAANVVSVKMEESDATANLADALSESAVTPLTIAATAPTAAATTPSAVNNALTTQEPVTAIPSPATAVPVTTIEAGDGESRKRKRQDASPEVSTPVEENIAQDRYVLPRTVPPSELPRDQVPACIAITRIDCEAYFEAELDKMKAAEQNGVTDEEAGDMGQIDAQLSQPEMIAPLSTDSEDVARRKRVKVDLADTSAAATPSSLEGHAGQPPPSSSLSPSWTEVQRHPPQYYLDTDVSEPFSLSTFSEGQRVVFRDIALHPTQRLPEIMVFVGIVQRVANTSVELDVKGPLLPTAHWDDLDSEPRTWTHAYHPDRVGVL